MAMKSSYTTPWDTIDASLQRDVLAGQTLAAKSDDAFDKGILRLPRTACPTRRAIHHRGWPDALKRCVQRVTIFNDTP